MTLRQTRSTPFVLLLCAGLLSISAPAFAAIFTVLDFAFGDQIDLTHGRGVWTAELDVTLGDKRTTSFCVDLATRLSVGNYETRAVLDAYTSPSPPDERERNFAWAGHVMDTFGHDLSALVGGAITRSHAITGVQAAIWEGAYGGAMVDADSLSDGARSVFDEIMASQISPGGGPAVIAELRKRQDQVVSNPVPEPSAAIVFGLGMLIVGRRVRR